MRAGWYGLHFRRIWSVVNPALAAACRPRFTGVAAVIGLLLFAASVATSQTVTAEPKHLTIPYLASGEAGDRAGDIEFAAAECDVREDDREMACRFRQIFITVASIDATACVITTNWYEANFRRDTPSRWVSAGAPTGDCGFVETTTLEDGGGTRWTMTVGKAPTKGADRACQSDPPQVYSWRDIKRKLPCTTIQPGAIER